MSKATLGLLICAGAVLWSSTRAWAVDCTNGCRVDRYGLSAPDSYGKEPDPVFEELNPQLAPLFRDFAGSLSFNKNTSDPSDPNCSGENGFVPVFGQILLREQQTCTTLATTGCDVEIAIDLNPPGTQVGSANESWFADSRLIAGDLGGNAFYINTASHGRIHGFGKRSQIGAGPGTRVHWDRFGTDSVLNKPGDPSDDFTRGDSRSKVCCAMPGVPNGCGALGLSTYPAITDTQSLGSVLKDIPDFIFVGGAGTRWEMDPNYVAPGQLHGVCRGNSASDTVSRAHRRVPCNVDACVSRGQVCNAGTSTCNGVTGPGAIPCVPNDIDECNNPNATCNLTTHLCNVGAGQHLSAAEVPCNADADCRLNDVCDLREFGARLRNTSTAPPTGDPSAIGSCLNDKRVACTAGGTECTTSGVGGACGVARAPIPTLCGEALFYLRGFPGQNCSLIASFLDFDQCEALAVAGQEAGCIIPVARCANNHALECSPSKCPGGTCECGTNQCLRVVGRRKGVCGLRPTGSTGSFTPVAPSVACEIDGDPGPDCMGKNYGAYIRPDVNCDGVTDVSEANDLCPHYNETDPFSDKNHDGRGDECQCGDSTTPVVSLAGGLYTRVRDGFVSVSDLVSTNLLIFNDPGAGTFSEGRYRVTAPTCDSTGDDRCDVSDIVGTNFEIFSPGYTARCFRFPCPEPLRTCLATGEALP